MHELISVCRDSRADMPYSLSTSSFNTTGGAHYGGGGINQSALNRPPPPPSEIPHVRPEYNIIVIS